MDLRSLMRIAGRGPDIVQLYRRQKVAPGPAQHDRTHSCLPDAVLPGQVNLPGTTRIGCPHLHNLLSGQFGSRTLLTPQDRLGMGNASMLCPSCQPLGVCPGVVSITTAPILWMQVRTVPIARSLPFLGYHVDPILSICARPEMRRIHALAIGYVASGVQRIAGVKNPQALRNWAIRQLPGDSVRVDVMATVPEDAIAGSIEESSPEPTPVRLADMLIETLLDWLDLVQVGALDAAKWLLRAIQPVDPSREGLTTVSTGGGRFGACHGILRLHLGSPIQSWGAALRGADNTAGAFARQPLYHKWEGAA